MPVFIYDAETGYWTLTRTRSAPVVESLMISRAFNPENWCRRCAALSAVITNPIPHTERMARWLARAARRGKTQPSRSHPLRVGSPPGASKRQKQIDPERQALLAYLNHLAHEAIFRGRDP